MKNGSVTIWMNLLGFERNDEDRGVKRFLEQTGYKPDAVCLLLCHSDFFNQYGGMEKEYTLHPDNCAYWGIPRNTERERQPWTNYDVRALAQNLAAEGIETYAGIFGTEQRNAFHNEWINEHPEIRRHGNRGELNKYHNGIFCLKRFKDGTYYEDFFIGMAEKALVDFGFTGIHLADAFCPARGGMLHNIDFSTDYIDQFLTHTGLELPEDVAKTMGDDSEVSEMLRSEWIYSNLREEWVRFNEWRWNVFFKKISDRLHAKNKKVSIIGMYCTDPFETLYCNGIDLKGAIEAGVDRISANILPTSVFFAGGDDRPYYFHKFMAIAPTTAAYIPRGHLVSMLGLQDATEEWNMMNHEPCLHERDAYTVMSYRMTDKDGSHRAVDGYFLCLGDGISKEDWSWERERLERSLEAKDAEAISASMLWSDAAHEKMLHEYIATRRWTPHKYFYEISKAGTNLGGTVRVDGLINYQGTLFVPNFDMLPEEEQKLILEYNGAVLCTATADYDISSLNTGIVFKDRFSTVPMQAFTLGATITNDLRASVEELIATDDGSENLTDILNVEEFDNTLIDTLVFSKVTKGFSDALALVLKEIDTMPFKIDKPNMVFRMPDGAYRLYIYNDNDSHYHRAFVVSEREIVDTRTVTHFPVLPPRFMDKAGGKLHHTYNGTDTAKHSFEIKIQPGGVTVIDVYLAK